MCLGLPGLGPSRRTGARERGSGPRLIMTPRPGLPGCSMSAFLLKAVIKMQAYTLREGAKTHPPNDWRDRLGSLANRPRLGATSGLDSTWRARSLTWPMPGACAAMALQLAGRGQGRHHGIAGGGLGPHDSSERRKGPVRATGGPGQCRYARGVFVPAHTARHANLGGDAAVLPGRAAALYAGPEPLSASRQPWTPSRRPVSSTTTPRPS